MVSLATEQKFKEMDLSPVAVFCHRRLDHLKAVIENLLLNKEAAHTELLIFADAAKESLDSKNVKLVRDYISNITGFKSLKIIERPSNYGLSRSIISGVNEVLGSYESVIVVEDDIVPSPFFCNT